MLLQWFSWIFLKILFRVPELRYRQIEIEMTSYNIYYYFCFIDIDAFVNMYGIYQSDLYSVFQLIQQYLSSKDPVVVWFVKAGVSGDPQCMSEFQRSRFQCQCQESEGKQTKNKELLSSMSFTQTVSRACDSGLGLVFQPQIIQ